MIIDADGQKRLFERDSSFVELITGKEKTFQSRTGLTFRFDINSECARTSDDRIFLYFYEDSSRGFVGPFPILHINGRAISFTKRRWTGKEAYYAVIPVDGQDGQTYWKMGEMGMRLSHKDPDKSFTYLPLTNATQFRDREEQELAITLLEDILSQLGGSWVRCAHGEHKPATVIFTPEFQEKLADGAFIEGHKP